jgi:hypothetical protein
VSEKTQLYAGVVIALLLGVAIGWIAKPAPSTPTGDTSRARGLGRGARGGAGRDQ